MGCGSTLGVEEVCAIIADKLAALGPDVHLSEVIPAAGGIYNAILTDGTIIPFKVDAANVCALDGDGNVTTVQACLDEAKASLADHETRIAALEADPDDNTTYTLTGAVPDPNDPLICIITLTGSDGSVQTATVNKPEVPEDSGTYLDGDTAPVVDLTAETLTFATIEDGTGNAGPPVVVDLSALIALLTSPTPVAGDNMTITPQADGTLLFTATDTDTTIPDTFVTITPNADGTWTVQPAGGGAPFDISDVDTDTYGGPLVATSAGTDFFGNAYDIGSQLVCFPNPADPANPLKVCIPNKPVLLPITTADGITDRLDGSGIMDNGFTYTDTDGVPLDQTCSGFCASYELKIAGYPNPLTADLCEGDTAFSNQSADWITYIDPNVSGIAWSANSVDFALDKRTIALAITNAQVANIAGTGQPRTAAGGSSAEGIEWVMCSTVDCNGAVSAPAENTFPVKCEMTTMFMSYNGTQTSHGPTVQTIGTMIDGVSRSASIDGTAAAWDVKALGSGGSGFDWTAHDTVLANIPSLNDASLNSRIALTGTSLKTWMTSEFSDEYVIMGTRGTIPHTDYSLEDDISFQSTAGSYHLADGALFGFIAARGGIGGGASNHPENQDDIANCDAFDRRYNYVLSGTERVARYGKLTSESYTVTSGTAAITPAFPVGNDTGSNNITIIDTFASFPAKHNIASSVSDDGIAPAGFGTVGQTIDHHIMTF